MISLLALVLSTTGLADAARKAVIHAILTGHRVSARPHAERHRWCSGKNRSSRLAAIPTVKNASAVGGLTVGAPLGLPARRRLTSARGA